MTVPPPAIMANRAAQVLSLMATNFFGQNTAAIAAPGDPVRRMWEQDATAMYDYAATSAAARTLTPFTSPQQDFNAQPVCRRKAPKSAARPPTPAPPTAAGWKPLEEIRIPPRRSRLFDTLFLEAGEIVNAIPFPASSGRVLFARRLAWYATIGSINNINSMGTTASLDRKFGDLARKLGSAAAAAAPPPADIAPGAFRQRDQHGQESRYRTEHYAARAKFRPRCAARGYHRANVPVPPGERAVTTVRAFGATPMTTHCPGSDASAAGVPWTARDASLGGGRAGVVPRYGVRLTVMTRPLGRVTSVRDGGATVAHCAFNTNELGLQ